MPDCIEKVTAFVIRQTCKGDELLLFEHPYAGIQIPAGTVEAGEMPEQTVLREVAEETGLTTATMCEYLGVVETTLPPNKRIILTSGACLCATRHDQLRLDYCTERHHGRCEPARGRLHADHVHRMGSRARPARHLDADHGLGAERRAYGHAPPSFLPAGFRWRDGRAVDGFHRQPSFTLFWAPLAALPPIIPPQDGWLAMLSRRVE